MDSVCKMYAILETVRYKKSTSLEVLLWAISI
jgi:hypothetical protein